MGTANRLRLLARPEETALIIRIASIVLAIPALLKLFKIEKIVRIITPARTRRPSPELPEQRIAYLCARVSGMFGAVARPSNCLRRCLLLYHVLRYYRVPVVIHFGVRMRNDELVGHSWLVLNGQLYDDKPEHVAEFTYVFSLPADETLAGGPAPGGVETPDMERIPYDD